MIRSKTRLLAAPAAALMALSGLAAVDAAADAPSYGPAVPVLTRGTFADPPASVRPKYRWWQPLAYTDDKELGRELDQIKKAGGGGAEVAPFSVEGAGNNTPEFLKTYGWGTPLWAEKTRTMLAQAKSKGLGLDFTIGPRWPAIVPNVADVNHPSAQQQIVFSHEFHKGGTSRSGALPTNFDTAPPAGAKRTLIAALVAKCEDAGCASAGAPRLLDRASVTDVTSKVDAQGALTVDFPGDDKSTYALIAFYQTPSGQSLSGYTATGTNYALDPFSKAGAKATTDFYDEHILTPDVRKLLAQMGESDLFEDSLEVGKTQKWTSEMVAQWTKLRGYSPVEVLPALAGAGDQGITERPFFDFGGGVGTRVRTDYRQTLSDLYIRNRLDVLREWGHRHHISTRIQPYGIPVDVSEAASHIDVPEGESLAFGQSVGAYSNVQDYRVVATGAHMSGQPVVSDECCAFSGSVWGSTAGAGTDASNLQAVYRGFAGGVNQVVWHGLPYLSRGPEGAGPQSAWPGMTYGGNTSYSEAWGDKGGPNWADYRAVNDNLARMQLVLRQGKPRFDLAVYWQDFGMNGTGTTGSGANKLIQSSSALASAGYTYEYLSPAHLRRKDATYSHGALFGDGSAYRAVLLNDQKTMPVDAAEKLLRLARQGLPVVIAGDVPSTVPGAADPAREDARLKSVVSELLRQRGVVRVASEADAPKALRNLQVTPAATPQDGSGALLDVRRQDGSTNYYYLYNQTNTATAQKVTLTGDGVPYRLDTWTGEITPITDYEAGHGTVTVPVRVAGNDATVIAVTPRRDATFPGRPGRPGNRPEHGKDVPQPVRLGEWSLSVDSWGPGASGLPGDTAHKALGPVTVKAGADGALPAWSAITPANGHPVDLKDVSGVGTYTAHVTLDDDWKGIDAAELDLGTPVDTVRVNVNGHDLPALNQADLRHVQVGRHLRPGNNTITVRVASTLLNAVRVAPGTGASSRAPMDYGLFGPVTLTAAGGDRPVLTAEALEPELPLADGGYNRANVLVTNASGRAADVTVTASSAEGITAKPEHGRVKVPARGSVTVPVELRDKGVASGTSALKVTVRSDAGPSAATAVTLRHSGDLALNPGGAPFPRVVATASQDRYPAKLAVDGSPDTFWVSWGRAAGQGPTPAEPAYFGIDFGAPVRFGSVVVGGRSNYGARDYAVQVSSDGRTWRTVATATDTPKEGGTTTFPEVTARHVRIAVSRSWDGIGANVQMSGFSVRPTASPSVPTTAGSPR
ncbi:F5/8 type C domain-containing protein [Actinomadura meyerae]|uniref:F5/8 type C domain-containing protein n=1 Tax=Actinomadura meyerae TaxID=240840 RepID=A0A239EML0_9ACTN|nr:glycosyl hydrolase [Actinomadura meyerae]SNS45990.1 F5/8 type C domain-containing protein [Actinomadura meyerae]